jgi:hypothetical protein
MLAFLEEFTNGFMGNIVGGTAANSVIMATLMLIVILVAILLAARLDLELALVIVSPAIIISSFAGLLPPLTFGIIVFLLALFWVGIIMALIR